MLQYTRYNIGYFDLFYIGGGGNDRGYIIIIMYFY